MKTVLVSKQGNAKTDILLWAFLKMKKAWGHKKQNPCSPDPEAAAKKGDFPENPRKFSLHSRRLIDALRKSSRSASVIKGFEGGHPPQDCRENH